MFGLFHVSTSNSSIKAHVFERNSSVGKRTFGRWRDIRRDVTSQTNLVLNEDQRRRMVEACKHVDTVVPNSPLIVTDEILDTHDILYYGDDSAEKFFQNAIKRGIMWYIPYHRIIDYENHRHGSGPKKQVSGVVYGCTVIIGTKKDICFFFLSTPSRKMRLTYRNSFFQGTMQMAFFKYGRRVRETMVRCSDIPEDTKCPVCLNMIGTKKVALRLPWAHFPREVHSSVDGRGEDVLPSPRVDVMLPRGGPTWMESIGGPSDRTSAGRVSSCTTTRGTAGLQPSPQGTTLLPQPVLEKHGMLLPQPARPGGPEGDSRLYRPASIRRR